MLARINNLTIWQSFTQMYAKKSHLLMRYIYALHGIIIVRCAIVHRSSFSSKQLWTIAISSGYFPPLSAALLRLNSARPRNKLFRFVQFGIPKG
jgi:hypothetical protein